MADIRLTQSTADAMLAAIGGQIDAGAEPGTLTFYTGTKPAVPGASTDETALAVLTFARPSAALSGSVLVFSALEPERNAPAAGTATWARATDAAGNAVFDCDVTAEGQGGTIQLDQTAIKMGALVQIQSFKISGA